MSRLTDIPTELLLCIIAWIVPTGGRLSNLAATSKPFQLMVGSITFQELELFDTDVQGFETIVTEHRFRALRKLTYILTRPDVARSLLSKNHHRVSRAELEACDFRWTIMMATLLRQLSYKNKLFPSNAPRVQLNLISMCHPVNLYLENENEDGGQPLWHQAEDHLNSGAMERCYVGSDCQSIDSTIQVPNVSEFVYVESSDFYKIQDKFSNVGPTTASTSRIWPAAIVSLSRHFPNAQKLRLSIADDERKDITRRRCARQEFAEALATVHYSSLDDLDLSHFGGHPPKDEFRAPPTISIANTDHDFLSTALGDFSRNLVTLHLRDVTLDLAAFLGVNADPRPQWPRLEKISMTLSRASPAGVWYFDKSSNFNMQEFLDLIDDDDESWEEYAESRILEHEHTEAPIDLPYRQFRRSIIPSVFREVNHDIITATGNMPKLREFGLDFDSYGSDEHSFRFYRGVKNRPSFAPAGSTDWIILWHILRAPDLEVLSDVAQAWMTAATEQNQSVDLLCWNEGKNGSRPCYRPVVI